MAILDWLMTMTIADGLIIFAVFLGPIVAVLAARWLDNAKEAKGRKVAIFKTLMATRGATLSLAHVEALNRIDLEFSVKNRKDKEVIEAWKVYLDLLNTRGLDENLWVDKRIELLLELLHKMAHALDYEFDKTHIKNSCYAPVAHATTEQQWNNIRAGLLKVVAGKQRVQIEITRPPKNQQGTTRENGDYQSPEG